MQSNNSGELLKSSIKPKKSLGQNFLHDQHYSKRIADALDVQKDDIVVEIGPGTGALTQWIYKKTDHYTAIEIDERAVDDLKLKFGDDFPVIHADVLTVDFNRFKTGGKRLKVIGNIPYYITSPILFHLIEYRTIIDSFVVMVQKEVADRIVSEPDGREYGILSVQFQYFCTCDYLFKVPAGAFYPPPKVDSAVIRFLFKQDQELEKTDISFFVKLVRQAFSMRRKTLRNNLKAYVVNEEKISIDLNRRSETLSVSEFVKLSNELLDLKK